MNSTTGNLSGVTAKFSSLLITLVWSSVSLHFDTFTTHFFKDRSMLFPSLTLVVVSLFNLFTCRHFEFLNSLSKTHVKCDSTCLLTLLGNCSLFSRTIYSFRSCNSPKLLLLISRILSLSRSFSAFFIMSFAFCVFMPHFILMLGGVTPLVEAPQRKHQVVSMSRDFLQPQLF